jgi:uncharacterized protein YndB with AHSA1/START domain
LVKTHDGYLLIADITGYTIYLNESELEHAQETLTALLELLVENTGPPLIISRLAGDAVISYGLRDRFFLGQTFIEKIEDTYVTFRQSLERLVLNNTCQCNACANISTLDLKFFVHYGTFGIQHISDHDELVGNDINLIHRLLKNGVTEETGFRAYAFYTEKVIQQLGAEEIRYAMTPHRETYDELGEVNGFVQNMHAVWESKRGSVSVDFPSDGILDKYEVDIQLPHEKVWDYLVQPEFRSILIGSDKMEVTNREQGRVAAGSVYQCYHGDKLYPQTILEWTPFERMIVREIAPINSSTSILAEYSVEPIETGTRLTKSVAKLTGPILPRTVMLVMTPIFRREMSRAMEVFARQIEKVDQAASVSV